MILSSRSWPALVNYIVSEPYCGRLEVTGMIAYTYEVSSSLIVLLRPAKFAALPFYLTFLPSIFIEIAAKNEAIYY